MPPRSKNRKDTVREIVNKLVARQGEFSNRDVAALTHTTRQAVHRQLANLVRTGVLATRGQGRATRYRTAAPPPGSAAFARSYKIAGLAEDDVWRDVAACLMPLAQPACKNAESLMAYALTEMVNNAVDHSGATEVIVRAGWGSSACPPARENDVWFEVTDHGVGAFENVRERLGLSDHLAALQEISKGKLSTQPERHSGEGLFFTAKMADHFELAANALAWLVDNRRQDEAVGTAAATPGTIVRFAVATDKTERPEDVFARYTHDFDFDTTRTVVKLFEYGVRFVSRSEAKRLVAGLERFAHVIVDFAGVEAVGQGFADELFRVWAHAHPGITVVAKNMVPPVAFMVGRAQPKASPTRR